MGLFPRHPRDHPRGHTVPTPDLHDLAPAASGQFEHSNDVYTNAWKLYLGGQSGAETGVGWVEYVGDLSRDGVVAGGSFGDGDIV